MPKRYLLLILALVGMTFCNSLLNGFVGDDEVMIVKNEFYRSFDNLPLLFSDQYLSDSREYFLNSGTYNSSGAVSYRPVNSLSYFIDRALWDLNPLGYHLHNVLLHLFNTALVFILVWLILRQGGLAAWSALFFGVHPLAVEAVCAVSYRHDLQATFFSLLAIVSYIHFRHMRHKVYYALCLLSYALAVFSKESAVLLPLVLLAYEFLYERGTASFRWRERIIPVLGLCAVTAGYLVVYVGIFPNTAVANNHLLGGTLATHFMQVAALAGRYIALWLLPFTVKPLPGLYDPTQEVWGTLQMGYLVLLALSLIVLLLKRKDRDVLFFVLMATAFYIPASNIIPLANPLAHRFMYLPLVGLSVALMLLLEQLEFPQLKLNVRLLMRISLIAAGMLTTFTLNAAWKDNLTIANSWTQDYPKHAKGHAILGIEYYKKGDCDKAHVAIEKALEIGDQDPRLFYLLGRCSIMSDAHAAANYLRALRLAPDYAGPYRGLGQIAERHGQYPQAMAYFKKSIEQQPTVGAYRYIVRCLRRMNRDIEKSDWLLRAREDLTPAEFKQLMQDITTDTGKR